MKKLMIIMAIVLCLVLPIVHAETIYKKGDAINLKVPFEVDGKIPLPSATCNITIQFPNGTDIVASGNMTNLGNGNFNYTIAGGDTTAIGVYTWSAYCCEATKCASGDGSFETTNTGIELTTQRTALYIFTLIIILFLFVLNIVLIPILPNKDNTDDLGQIMSINKLKYVRPVLYVTAWALLVSIMFIASNVAYAYMGTELVADFLFTIYRLLFYISIPGIFVWFIYIFIQVFRDIEVKRMIERGIDVQSP